MNAPATTDAAPQNRAEAAAYVVAPEGTCTVPIQASRGVLMYRAQNSVAQPNLHSRRYKLLRAVIHTYSAIAHLSSAVAIKACKEEHDIDTVFQPTTDSNIADTPREGPCGNALSQEQDYHPAACAPESIMNLTPEAAVAREPDTTERIPEAAGNEPAAPEADTVEPVAEATEEVPDNRAVACPRKGCA